MKKYLLISYIVFMMLWATIIVLKAHLGGEYEPPMWAQMIIFAILGNTGIGVIIMITKAIRGKLF